LGNDPSNRWRSIRNSCSSGPIVSNNGDCITYVTARDSIRNYSNDYNRLRGLYNGDWNRASRAERDNLNRLYQLDRRYRGDWNSRLSGLRTVCQDNTPPVVIINDAPPLAYATAPAPVVAAPATPSAVAGTQATAPSSAVDTGGWDVAAVLAHARAI